MELIDKSKFNLLFALPHERGHRKWVLSTTKILDIIFGYQYPSDENSYINPRKLILMYQSKFSL
jgi:hypothetical protein